ncbi:MAG: hypothetical protein NTZ78_08090, partial [Candidatus Aureabacteria bacterium]|nr:hypothetical protein [Candidatus Auribacterota bacterium]
MYHKIISIITPYSPRSRGLTAQEPEYRIQETGDRSLKTEYRIQETGDRSLKTEYRIQNTEYRIQETGDKRFLEMPLFLILYPGFCILAFPFWILAPDCLSSYVEASAP